ncbi:hypothetical protein P5673_019284 [Acropora cervicornis]|uniref:Uncharacterized protein n=1 Tax=Acropora cervicornis TaxID=6130 RepID=A0AAD9V2B3_ACRCE|nr:hypothetical protein P5673_019284 [Acropora cervicornis]
MENKGKLNFLWMILVVLFLYLIIDIIPRTSANKRSATRNRLRKQECKDNVQTHDTCVKLVNELGLQVADLSQTADEIEEDVAGIHTLLPQIFMELKDALNAKITLRPAAVSGNFASVKRRRTNHSSSCIVH